MVASTFAEDSVINKYKTASSLRIVVRQFWGLISVLKYLILQADMLLLRYIFESLNRQFRLP